MLLVGMFYSLTAIGLAATLAAAGERDLQGIIIASAFWPLLLAAGLGKLWGEKRKRPLR
jgi:hypothetical protein